MDNQKVLSNLEVNSKWSLEDYENDMIPKPGTLKGLKYCLECTITSWTFC